MELHFRPKTGVFGPKHGFTAVFDPSAGTSVTPQGERAEAERARPVIYMFMRSNLASNYIDLFPPKEDAKP
jgi:hypothetical protein